VTHHVSDGQFAFAIGPEFWPIIDHFCIVTEESPVDHLGDYDRSENLRATVHVDDGIGSVQVVFHFGRQSPQIHHFLLADVDADLRLGVHSIAQHLIEHVAHGLVPRRHRAVCKTHLVCSLEVFRFGL